MYSLTTAEGQSIAYSDLTGRFPYTSSRGNQYIMVAYHYDANAILVEPIKNRNAQTLVQAWNKLNNRFRQAGVTPTTYIMDNEASRELKQAISLEKISYQLVPPHNHRANAAERAIQTFKAHYKTGLALLHPDFPLREWDRLTVQAELTLNLLRSARINPRLSAWAYLFGQYDYQRTPIAPPGTKVIAHLKTSQRGSWSPNGEPAWTVGPALEHYRCLTCYFPQTRAERHVDTVKFFPHTVPIPKMQLEDFLRQTATDIVHLLKQPPSSVVPSLQAGEPTYNAIRDIACIFNQPELLPNLKQIQQPRASSPVLNNAPCVTTQLPALPRV